jgi:hypothetical protein
MNENFLTTDLQKSIKIFFKVLAIQNDTLMIFRISQAIKNRLNLHLHKNINFTDFHLNGKCDESFKSRSELPKILKIFH